MSRMRAIRRAAPAIVDQGLWSAAGFVMTVAIGRTLGPNALGSYALAYAVLLGIGSLYNSIILEPLVVLGPAKFKDSLGAYAGLALLATISTTVIAIPVWLLLSLVATSITLTAVATAALVAPVVMTAWVARRLPYLNGRQWVAVGGSAGYLMTVVAILIGLVSFDRLTPAVAFYVIAAASIVQIVIVVWRWRPRLVRRPHNRLVTRAVAEHWKYGKWMLATSAVFWVGAHGYVTLVALLLGTADTGGLKASESLVAPAGLIFAALSLNYTPELTRTRVETGTSAIKESLGHLQMSFASIGAVLLVFAVAFGEPVLTVAYGNEFRDYSWLLVSLAALTVVRGWAHGGTVGLRAMEYPKGMFRAQALSALTVPVFGYPLGVALGLQGIVLAMATSSIVLAVAVQVILQKRLAS